ncbi:MAG: TlpA family protein disulfide reductase [Opitutae bacterium]|nr:TlpA family protein disulfide reductase [Opitutae bacterium]
MKKRFLAALALALAVLFLPAFAADADADYAAWKSVYERSPRDVVPRGDRAAQDAFWTRKAGDLDALAQQFLAAHPADARRWEVMLRTVPMDRWLQWPDEAARAASQARHRDWLARTATSNEAPIELRDQAQAQLISVEIDAARSALTHDHTVDSRALAARLDEFGETYPDSRNRARLEQMLFAVLSLSDRALGLERAERLAATSGPLAQVGKDWVRKLGLVGQTMEMKFTAADGTEVDLAALRGKVVLVDFWATWCGPCMNEMPNVKAVYAKFHAQGFEIVGISLDGGGITKGIKSGVKTREDFLAFLKREEMPWPQHFANEGWKNEFAQRFGIKSIPAVFLIGKDGKVVSTEARGEALEAQVRRALGL